MWSNKVQRKTLFWGIAYLTIQSYAKDFNPMPKFMQLILVLVTHVLHLSCPFYIPNHQKYYSNISNSVQHQISNAWVNMQFYLFLNSVIWRKMLHTHIVLKCLQLVWHQANYFPLQNTHRIKQNILLPMAYRKYNKFFTMAHTKYNSLV